MDETDKIIKQVWTKVGRSGPEVKSKCCPGDRILSLYADGILNESERERTERHLLECDYCLDLVLLHKKTADEKAYAESPDAPALWKEMTKSLVGERVKECREGLFDIILKFTKDTIEVISNPGKLAAAYGPMPEPLRSGNKILSPNLIILSKTFSDMESEVEVERIDDRHVNMKIRTMDVHSKAPAKVLRVSLFNPIRELASYITDDGAVSFGNLNYGAYEIKIIKGREEIGHISLNITSNAN
jgi:hypothetical protein